MSENLFIIYAIFTFFSLGATLGLFARSYKYHSYLTHIPSSFASILTIALSLVVTPSFAKPIKIFFESSSDILHDKIVKRLSIPTIMTASICNRSNNSSVILS
ncbi:hypothetical protein YTPLAS73_06150 [Nitrosarchaeum sp.]|nr:hypothetical protein YTPLAS73_06150 [Nitrosarchaeum sp.]